VSAEGQGKHQRNKGKRGSGREDAEGKKREHVGEERGNKFEFKI